MHTVLDSQRYVCHEGGASENTHLHQVLNASWSSSGSKEEKQIQEALMSYIQTRIWIQSITSMTRDVFLHKSHKNYSSDLRRDETFIRSEPPVQTELDPDTELFKPLTVFPDGAF